MKDYVFSFSAKKLGRDAEHSMCELHPPILISYESHCLALRQPAPTVYLLVRKKHLDGKCLSMYATDKPSLLSYLCEPLTDLKWVRKFR